MKGYEGLNADEIVEKLKKVGWEDIYDGDSMRLQKGGESKLDENTLIMYYTMWAANQVNKDYNVLDVGCGISKLIYVMKKKGAKCTGVDVSPKVIEQVKTMIKDVEFKQMYAEKLEFEDNLFDCVTSTELLEHVPEPKAVIKEMVRVLKPGGKLVITIPIRNNFALDGKAKHIQNLGFYEVIHLFEEFGENFKIHWLNKFKHTINEEDKWSDPEKKNVFGIVFIKDEVKE